MKKKKIGIIILCIVLVILVAGGGVGYSLLPHSLNYDIDSLENIGKTVNVVSKGSDSVTIKCESDAQFKVIAFTDLHLDGKNKTSYMTVDNLVKNIIKEQPDLVILGGDNVTSGFNKKRANQFAEIFENLGVYWAGVLGNHEGDNKYSLTRPEMIEVFSSYEHCLMLEGPEDIWGDGNYYINILNPDNSLREMFVFMDTGDEVSEETKKEYGIPPEESPYDGVKTSQVEWYKEIITNNKKEYGKFSSIAVMHIPLPQYENAFSEVEAGKNEFLYGNKLENICESGFDSGLFDAIKELKSTKAVFCGHDHLNDFGIEYKGVLLGYLQPSGYGSYTSASKLGYEEKDWLQGYTVFEILKDGTFSQTHYRNSAEG